MFCFGLVYPKRFFVSLPRPFLRRFRRKRRFLSVVFRCSAGVDDCGEGVPVCVTALFLVFRFVAFLVAATAAAAAAVHHGMGQGGGKA